MGFNNLHLPPNKPKNRSTVWKEIIMTALSEHRRRGVTSGSSLHPCSVSGCRELLLPRWSCPQRAQEEQTWLLEVSIPLEHHSSTAGGWWCLSKPCLLSHRDIGA